MHFGFGGFRGSPVMNTEGALAAGTGSAPPAATTRAAAPPAGSGATSGGGSTSGSAPGAGGSSGGGTTSGSQPWFSSLPAEERAFAETKGYKDVAEALRSHRNLESLLGAPKERLLKLPEKGIAEDRAGWDAVFQRLGKPEKADGYDRKAFGEGVSDTDAKWLQDTFLDLNLSKTQGETLATKWAEKMKGVVTGMEEQAVQASQQQLEKLRQDWGPAFEEKKAVANKVFDALGLTDKEWEAGERALGVDGWTKMLAGMAEKFGITFSEAGFHRGDGAPPREGALSTESARAEIKRLERDSAFIKQLGEGNAEARAKLDRLHKAAFPGMTVAEAQAPFS